MQINYALFLLIILVVIRFDLSDQFLRMIEISKRHGLIRLQEKDDQFFNQVGKNSDDNNKEAPIYFFDLDNTLYPKSSGIDELMTQRIESFFVNYLKLSQEESRILGSRFYKDYGLTIKGLIKHFKIDPLEYERYVDGGLPLEEILKPTPALKNLLHRMSQKGSCWIFTNAGRYHALRVLSLLQIETYFEDIIYCDYSEINFPAKPDQSAYLRAMTCAGVNDPNRCYFFDDSLKNIRAAQELGWNVVYINEEEELLDQSVSNEVEEKEIDSLACTKAEDNQEIKFPTVRFIEDVEEILD